MTETSKTVSHALQVLLCFSRGAPLLSASSIARSLKLPRTNVLRLLATLEAHGFIERHPEKPGYQIGLRALEVGTLYLAANPFSAILTSALDRLVEETHCTAYLAVLDGADIVMLNYREGTLPIRFVWREGDRLPSTSTALGKAILSHFSDEQIDRLLGKGEQLRGLTGRSLRTRSELNAELVEARKRGWAVAHEESHAGLTAVGCAVLDENKRPIAALSVSYFDYPPDPLRQSQLAAIVQGQSKEVTRRIADYRVYGIGISRDSSSYHSAGDGRSPPSPPFNDPSIRNVS